jgi:hypothetical protein
MSRSWLFSAIMKQPSVQGVHATTAIGNANRDRKLREYNQQDANTSVSTKRPKVEEHEQDQDDENDQDIVRGVKPNGKSKFWSLPLELRKADADRRLIYGWASVSAIDGSHVIDKQGDIIPIDALERAVIQYGLESRDGSDMHEPETRGQMKLVQGLVFTPELEKLNVVAKNDDGKVIHGWLACYYVPNDKLWAAIKRGDRPELSIGGQALVIEVDVGKGGRQDA